MPKTERNDRHGKKPAGTSRKTSGKKSPEKPMAAVNDARTTDYLPVVAIGASARGLKAFEQSFTHTPPGTGMACVPVRHLDPKHKSILSELVRRYTKMSVYEVRTA